MVAFLRNELSGVSGQPSARKAQLRRPVLGVSELRGAPQGLRGTHACVWSRSISLWLNADG
jgi:hypothetical protein